MKQHIYIVLFLSIFGCACQQPQIVEAETVIVDQLYSVDLPNNLKPGFDMHDYAGLQHYDTSTDFYVIGIEDAKDNLGAIKRRRLKLKNYYSFVENTVFSRADSTQLIADQKFTTDQGIKSQVGDYFVSSQNWGAPYRLFYRIAVYESDDYFFQIVIWMPYDLYCERYKWIEGISNSFQLLDNAEEVDAAVSRAETQIKPGK